MALTTHEKIRVEAGFQSRFIRQSFKSNPDGSASTFYVKSDENYKIVPDLGTGGTIAGISDIEVWLGLSGINGASQMGVSAIDPNIGSITLNTVPDNGASLTVNYASSAISSKDIETARLRAESIINQRLSLCYSLPLSPVPSQVESMASRLGSALLLIRGYGTGSIDTAEDGYRLYQQLMGDNPQIVGNRGNQVLEINPGEVGLICTTNYQLVDDSGAIIPRIDDETSTTGADYQIGGRVRGRLYDITEEEFRFKEPQEDADTNQPGTLGNAPRKYQN